MLQKKLICGAFKYGVLLAVYNLLNVLSNFTQRFEQNARGGSGIARYLKKAGTPRAHKRGRAVLYLIVMQYELLAG